jgi:hypothetical protein
MFLFTNEDDRILAGIGHRNSFKQTLLQKFFLSHPYVVDNMGQYYFVSDIHNRNTRQVFNLNPYQPPNHLSLYQKRPILCLLYYIVFIQRSKHP